jgi:DNA-binding transcriptional LysR family regulator
MDRITTLSVFRRVAELGSFSAAARELRLSNAAVSKYVAVLEERLRTRLLQRTTRSVSLTPAGAAYLERVARILDDLEELDDAAMKNSTVVRGTLRVNGPNAFGLMYLAPAIPALLEQWPELHVDLSLTDRFVDLIEEGVDVVVRITTVLRDSATLVAQRLASCDQVVFATPAYLRKRGTPKQPSDLSNHECLVYGLRTPVWQFGRDGKALDVPVAGRLRVDNSLALRDAVLAHAGLAMLPRFYVQDLLDAGRVRAVMTDTGAPTINIFAVYPRQRHLATKVRVFIDHLREDFARAPWASDGSNAPRSRARS